MHDVLTIWRDLFATGTVDNVDPASNFFALGGNSLLVVRFRARLRELGYHLPELRDVYLHPTPEKMAARLAQLGRDHGEEAVPCP